MSSTQLGSLNSCNGLMNLNPLDVSYKSSSNSSLSEDRWPQTAIKKVMVDVREEHVQAIQQAVSERREEEKTAIDTAKLEGRFILRDAGTRVPPVRLNLVDRGADFSQQELVIDKGANFVAIHRSPQEQPVPPPGLLARMRAACLNCLRWCFGRAPR